MNATGHRSGGGAVLAPSKLVCSYGLGEVSPRIDPRGSTPINKNGQSNWLVLCEGSTTRLIPLRGGSDSRTLTTLGRWGYVPPH